PLVALALLGALSFCSYSYRPHLHLHSFPTRRSSDLSMTSLMSTFSSESSANCSSSISSISRASCCANAPNGINPHKSRYMYLLRSEEHTSELQSRENLVCRLLLEKKKRTRVEQCAPI